MRALLRPALGLIAAVTASLALVGCHKSVSGAGGEDMAQGKASAPVTVVEYASVTCPHCARFNADVFPGFKAKYVDTGKVHYVFKEALIHPDLDAAGYLLARCAGKDKYFTVIDAIMRSQSEIEATGDVRDIYLRIGQSAGLSRDQVETCISDENALKSLSDRITKSMKADSVNSTPTFLVDGVKLKEGEISMAELDAALQPKLAKKP